MGYFTIRPTKFFQQSFEANIYMFVTIHTVQLYEGRSINKLQNGIILLIFKI